jgi:hypothetical protein
MVSSIGASSASSDVNLAGHRGGDEGGAEFLEAVDGFPDFS